MRGPTATRSTHCDHPRRGPDGDTGAAARRTRRPQARGDRAREERGGRRAATAGPATPTPDAATPASTGAPVANAPAGTQPRDLPPAKRPTATPQRTLHMIGNAHLDPVWLWPWQEGYQEARATFWSAIHRMEEYPDFVFTCDQIVLLSWVEESDPELFEQIRRRVAEGRWVNVGGWWVEPDNNMPMGESFVRQGLYGQRYLRVALRRPGDGRHERRPVRPQRDAPADPARPGHGLVHVPAARPARVRPRADPVLVGGARRLARARVPHPVRVRQPARLRRRPDREVARGARPHGRLRRERHRDGLLRRRQPRRRSDDREHRVHPPLRPDGLLRKDDDVLTAHVLRRGARPRRGVPRRPPGAPRRPAAPRARLLLGALGHQGLAAPRAVRRAERRALGGRRGRDRRRRPTRASSWRPPGSRCCSTSSTTSCPARRSSRPTTTRATSSARPSRSRSGSSPAPTTSSPARCRSTGRTALSRSSSSTRTPGRCRWMSTSSTARSAAACTWSMRPAGRSSSRTRSRPRRRMTCRAARSCSVPRSPRSATACTGCVRAPVPGRPPVRLTVTADTLENDHVRIRIDPETGWISSYLVKATGVDVMAGVDGTQHTQINDDPTDTWGHRVISYAWPGATMALKRIVVRETGPLRSRVRVEREWGASTLVEELILDHDSSVLRVNVTLDWREQAHLLKLRFPTVLDDPTATYEIPFGHLQRPVDGAEEPAQSWVDLTGTVDGTPAGLTVITTNKHGYDVSPASDENGGQPSIGVTAVRSPVYSWHDPRLLDPEGIYSFQDQGVQRFSYELVPHAGDWRTADPIRRALVLGNPVRAMQESFHDGALPPVHSFAGDGGDAVMVTALKGTRGCVGRPRRRGRGRARGRDARRGRPVADRAPPARPHDRGGLRPLAAPHLHRAGGPGRAGAGGRPDRAPAAVSARPEVRVSVVGAAADARPGAGGVGRRRPRVAAHPARDLHRRPAGRGFRAGGSARPRRGRPVVAHPRSLLRREPPGREHARLPAVRDRRLHAGAARRARQRHVGVPRRPGGDACGVRVGRSGPGRSRARRGRDVRARADRTRARPRCRAGATRR